MSRVGILGASGFLGSTVTEHLVASGKYDVIAFVGSLGNAWRLTRNPSIKLRQIDVADAKSVRHALEDCTFVVNCVRGDQFVMLSGLRNVLNACNDIGVRRFVHISSVAIYGDPPPQASVREDAPVAVLEKGSYGWIKARQDQMVEQASRKGLQSVILCPPNISGAYSPFCLAVLKALQSGSMVLVENGERPCNLVDVANLASAVEKALDSENAAADRYFITDDEAITWRDVVAELLPLVPGDPQVADIAESEAAEICAAPSKARPSFRASLRHLCSDSVRGALTEDPGIRTIYQSARKMLHVACPWLEDRLKALFAESGQVSEKPKQVLVDKLLCKMQLRTVRHSCEKAKRNLNYRPLYSFSESMAIFRRWYVLTHGDKSAITRWLDVGDYPG